MCYHQPYEFLEPIINNAEGNFDGEKICRITLHTVFGGIKFGKLLRSHAPFAG